MKPAKVILLLLPFLIVTSCIKKNKPSSIPCFGSFTCHINGVPFKTEGDFGCSSKGFSYSPIDSNTVTIYGFNCSVKRNGFRAVVFDIYHVAGPGTYPIGETNCAYKNENGVSLPHNIETGGEVKITRLIESNYSDDYTGGIIEGSFWFSAYNQDTKDTVHITNGYFCGRI